jgi:oligopeptide/dipeptide ABC transporter ATP-binding protein
MTIAAPPVLEVRNLKKYFAVRKGLLSREVATVYAVDGISFAIRQGETLGLVGESGCGKSTAGKLILKLIEPTAGEIQLDGARIDGLSRGAMRPYRKGLQVVFQDPYASLNPRMRAKDIVAEPIRNFERLPEAEIEARAAELFEKVGLRRDQMIRFPHEFSGGQRQRLVIARALALRPKLIVCDEPVSALDVSVRAQVINLLIDLQRDFGLSYLFIAHDLAVVEHISHRVAVMYLGRIVEMTDKRSLFEMPLHPYTEALLSAVPIPKASARGRRRVILTGDVPSPINPPPGCHFHARCPYVMPRCKIDVPTLREVTPGHFASCHLHDGGMKFPLGVAG